MLENINAIQSHLSPTTMMTTLTNTYIKESLSNLGQRLGLKGDSVVNSTLSTNIWKATYKYSDESIKLYRHGNNTYEDIAKEIFYDYVTLTPQRFGNGFITVYEYCGGINNFLVDFISKTPLESSESYTYCFRACDETGTIHNGFKGWCILNVGEDSQLKEALCFDSDRQELLTYDSSRASDKTITYEVNYDYVTLKNTGYLDEIKVGEKTIQNLLNDKILADQTANPTSNKADIQTLVDYFRTVLFKYIKTTYNTQKFSNSISDAIICRLVKKLANDCGLDPAENQSSNSNTTVTVIFPIKTGSSTFDIPVVINDNSSIIYNSYDFQCKFIEDDNLDIVNEETASTYNEITCQGTESKYSAYNFVITYVDDKFVDTINVNKLYELPYINPDTNTWIINGQDSGIQATGEDAGQPNILMIETKYEGTAKISEVIFSNKKFSNITWNDFKDFSFNFNLNITQVGSASPDNSKVVTTQLPKVNQTNLEAVENALIISVCSVNGILGENTPFKITSFWKYVSGTGSDTTYEVIKDTTHTNYALDLSNMISLAELTKYFTDTQYEPDKYFHSHVVFDRVNNVFKQSGSEENTYAYPVIKTKTITTGEGTTSDPTKNDGVMIPYFVNIINFDDNNTSIQSVPEYNNPADKWFNPSKVMYVQDTLNGGGYIPAKPSNGTVDMPSGIIPMLDLSEILVLHPTIINRLNFMFSTSNTTTTNTPYNVFMDVRTVNNTDEFIIGSSNKNNNLGNKTLIDDVNNVFTKLNKAVIDFSDTTINGALAIKGNTSIDGDLTLENHLIVNEDITVEQNIEAVTGNIEANSGSVISRRPVFTYCKTDNGKNYYSAIVPIVNVSDYIDIEHKTIRSKYVNEDTFDIPKLKYTMFRSVYNVMLKEDQENWTMYISTIDTSKTLIHIICSKSSNGDFVLEEASEVLNNTNLSLQEYIKQTTNY